MNTSTVLYIYIVGQGTSGIRDQVIATGGFNGGGSSIGSVNSTGRIDQDYCYATSGGGGATDIRVNIDDINHRVIVAGGGGWYGGGYGISAGGGSGWVYTAETFDVWQAGNPTDAALWQLDSRYYLTDAETIAGDQTFAAPDGTPETGHSGHGYARITFIAPVELE